MFDKILMPTDGSDVSLKAADRALALAKLAGAPLHIVYVLEPYPYAGVGYANTTGLQEHLAAGHRHAAEAFGRVTAQAQPLGVAVSTEVAEGRSPADEIVAAAGRAGADAIVMGSHGRTGVARAVLGSVAAKVVALAPVAVMIVR